MLTFWSADVSSTEDHFSDAPEGPHDHDDSSIPSPSPSAHTTNDSSTPQSTTAPEIMRLSEEAEKDPAAHGAFGSDGNDDKVWGIKTHPGKVVANGDAGSSAGPETPESPEIIVKWNEKQDVIHPKVRGERARIEQLVEAQREQRKNRSTSITSVRKSPSSGQEEGLNEMECEKKEKKEDAEAAIGDGVETIATTGGDAELITATGDEAKSDTAEAATPPLAENLVVCESDKNEESKDEESIASPRNDVKSETTRADTPPPEELEPATVPSPAPSQKSTETREATLASEFTPDPPTPIEQATFDISGAAVIGEEDDFGEEPVFDTPEAATGGDDFGDDFEGNAGGDDFDDFSYSVEADGDGFDDFDDFGGFEDGEGFDEPEEPTPPPPPPPPPPRVIIPPLPVPLPDFQNQAGLADALSSAAETMFPREISDPRKPSSIEGRSFLTERR